MKRRSPAVVALTVLIVTCVLAGREGVRATADLEWPLETDLRRDIGTAEAMRLGHPLSDAAYAGEWLWYNPLTPWIVGTIAAATGQPTHTAYVRAGAWLNLLAPFALFVLVAALFEVQAAACTVVALVLLMPGREPAWLGATYSPWLLAMHFTQGLFYAALFLAWRLRSRGTMTDAMAAGGALGLVFLGHTAPALILGGSLLILLVDGCRKSGWRVVVFRRRTIAFLLTAIVVAAPFLFSLVHYAGIIQNHAVSSWTPDELSSGQFWGYIGGRLVPSWIGVVALVGYVRLWRMRSTPAGQIVLAATASALFWFVYGSIASLTTGSGFRLPTLVPSFHFLYYARAFEAIAFGLGAVSLVEWMVTRGPRAPKVALVLAALLPAVLLGAAMRNLDRYRTRPDFATESAGSRASVPHADVRAFLLGSTGPGDVILADDWTALHIIVPLGRHVVAMNEFFSNPFVDLERRRADRDRMDVLLDQGDWPAFRELAGAYGVRYVLRQAVLETEDRLACCIDRVWTSAALVAYRLRQWPEGGAP